MIRTYCYFFIIFHCLFLTSLFYSKNKKTRCLISKTPRFIYKQFTYLLLFLPDFFIMDLDLDFPLIQEVFFGSIDNFGNLPVATASFNSEPAENAGAFFAGILIFSVGLCGLTPILAFLCLLSKVPKPTKVTFSPRAKAADTL